MRTRIEHYPASQVARRIRDFGKSLGVIIGIRAASGDELELLDFHADKPDGARMVLDRIEDLADETGLKIFAYPIGPRTRALFSQFGFINESSGTRMVRAPRGV